ncbi:hypothetical protein DNTS_032577 [Danionella cerebrum]|uniref:Uncharacterized protein n=1 Tax=Danionella cerebrum TaxID=2873325 RepID=A0A553PY65_9TELE|nr:hypothetical protein DNTS_032577 [Danionella translucida]
MNVMESYEEFVRRLYVKHQNDDEDDDEPNDISKPSLIVFRGLPVLPPVLDLQQRMEMRRLREAAMGLQIKRRRRRDEESQFSDITEPNLTGSHMITLPPPAPFTSHLLTSTTHDAQSAGQMSAAIEDQSDKVSQFSASEHRDHISNHALGQAPVSHYVMDSSWFSHCALEDKFPESQMMMSSGYVTNTTPDISCQSSWMDATTKTKTKNTGSDIISHAPVDGSILEEEALQRQMEDDQPESLPLSKPVDEEVIREDKEDCPDLDDHAPYRMSLQTLLKKSQDYRRRQKILRCQAKTLRMPEEGSDKENEESHEQIWRIEMRRAREKRKEKMEKTSNNDEQCTHTTQEEETNQTGSEEQTKSDGSLCVSNQNMINLCRSVTESECPLDQKMIEVSQSTTESPESSRSEGVHGEKKIGVGRLVTESSYLEEATSVSEQEMMRASPSTSEDGSRFICIPTPKFSLSPMRCKKPRRTCGALHKTLTEAPIHPNMLSSPGTMDDSKKTEQIAQLELNLSSLKALISDLESTLVLSLSDELGNTSGITLDLPQSMGTSPSETNEWTSGTPLESTLTPLISFCEAVPQENTKLWANNQDVGGVNDGGSRMHGNEELVSAVIGSSYDVATPSGLWRQLTSGSGGSRNHCLETTQEPGSTVIGCWSDSSALSALSPESVEQEFTSRVKRRLLMNEDETAEDPVQTLVNEEQRIQRELLQSVVARYRFLRSVSFPCTSSTLEEMRPLTHNESELIRAQVCVAAAVRGFLTRRLLRTERVSRLVTTIKDTQMFLWSLSCISSRNERMLQERVALQLRSARLQLHQIFFSTASSQRMKIIDQDRELSRERQRQRRPNGKVKQFLSAATRKALERKKQLILQQRASSSLGEKCSPRAEEKTNLVPKMCSVSGNRRSARRVR